MIQLKKAKYKNVEFLFIDAPTTGGNRLIKFRYPGSNNQSIERQGRTPRSYKMTIVIPHENYFSERDSLLNVLESQDPGVLVHPTFGDIENVLSGQYTITEKISDLGRAEISCIFEVDDGDGVPIQSANLPTQVARQSDLLNSQLSSDFEDWYAISLQNSGNFNDAIETVNDAIDIFEAASVLSGVDSDVLTQYRKTLNVFRSTVGALIQVPANLSSAINDTFLILSNLYPNHDDQYAAFNEIFSFGSNQTVINPTTTGLIDRKRNRDLLQANMVGKALSYAYSAASQIQYQTTSELDLVVSGTESVYLSIRSNTQASNESLEQLDRLRSQAQKSFDVARTNSKSLTTISTTRKPLSVLLYEYYGSTDLFDTIADLNNIKQNAFVEGDVLVLSE